MKLLFILDPLDELKAYKDTSVAMMRAAQARGHQVLACEQRDLHSKDRVHANAGRLSLADNDEDWVRAHPKETAALVTWLIYAVYLHARNRRSWAGRPAALLLVVGFGMVLVTYSGSLWFSGLHAYSGL